MPTPAAPVLTADGLGFAFGEKAVLRALSFVIAPGLTWVTGGDGSGKTTLLQLLAGHRQPTTGRLHRDAASVAESSAVLDEQFNGITAQDWLVRPRASQTPPDPAELAELVTRFRLDEHLAKPLYMLSTGSRRKLGLVAAATSGAALTLLDLPYAALDAGACQVLNSLLDTAAAQTSRAWVVTDYGVPAGLKSAAKSCHLNLDDPGHSALHTQPPGPLASRSS